jgi:hypothetical protein
MKTKKILSMLAVLFLSAAMSAQCMISGSAAFNTLNTCNGSNINVSGTVNLKKLIGGVYTSCGGNVTVEVQKLISGSWSFVSSQITNSTYNIPIASSNGNGSYRVVATNPASSCSCLSTTNYTSSTSNLTFTSSHDHTYSINGTPTFNSPCIRVCDNTNIMMDNIVMTNQNATASINKWRVGTANDVWLSSFTFTGWFTGAPPSSYNLLTLLNTNYPGTTISGAYGFKLETYNGCNTVSHFSCINVDVPPAFIVGQKYDATNYTTISAGTTCSSPFTNLCPVYTAPYSYMMTALNSTIPAYQINNGQWSCTLEEVPVGNCAATPSLVFTTSYATIGSMSNLDNIDLNALAVAAGFPSNYISTLKRYKFTLNIKYSCGDVYTFVCWLRYTTSGCRIRGEKEEEIDETLNNFISVYPNPVNNVLEIKADNAIKSVILIDVSGKQTTAELKNNTIDMSKFSAGMYTIKIYTTDGVSIKKIVKQD